MGEAMEDLINRTAIQLSGMLERGKVSSREIMDAHLVRTRNVDTAVGAFLSIDEEDARAQADASDRRRAEGVGRGPMEGIPVAIKDVLAVRGQPLGCASAMLKGFVSPYDAHVIERLRAAGAIVWGRLNMDEFAMGSSTENSSQQVTSNPWDLSRVPGGSSGGSAAAVAAREAVLSLGSDTGGSVRQPAAFCGVAGLKPTYGRVSRYGLVAFASSLDQIGPLGRTIDDVAMLLHAIAGHDDRDSTSINRPVPSYGSDEASTERKWRIGVPKEYFGAGMDPEIRAAIDRALAFYRKTDCEVVEISLPHTEYAVATYYIIATAEASSNLARYDGVRFGHRAAEAADGVDLYFQSRAEGFGPEVKRRIILGTYVLSSGYYDAYYLRAQKVRTLIRQDFLNAFEQVDVVLTPTSPAPAFRRGEKTSDPLEMYLSDIYTLSANLAGIPGLSLPCGFTDAGLPIGMQILGRPFGEAEILSIGRRFEVAHDFAGRTPAL